MPFIQFLRRVGGTAIFMIGVVSLVLPVLPGLPLIAFGFYILSIDSPRVRERVRLWRVKWKSFDSAMASFERRLLKKVVKDEQTEQV